MDENKKKLNNDELKVLRTYTSDMADAIRINEESVIKIALAEKEKREREEEYKKAEGTNTSKILLVIGGIILIVSAIAGSYFLIAKKKEIQTPAIVSNIDTFINYDSYSYVDLTNIINGKDLLSKISQLEQKNSGVVKALFLTKSSDSSQVLNTADFFSIFKINAPGPLIRSLADKYLIGEYLDPNPIIENQKSSIFLIFQTSNYNQTYASMLDWEKTMPQDLNTLLKLNIPESNNDSSLSWKDIIINNRDARVLYGKEGEALIYYIFVNKNNFIITNKIEVLKEITARLLTKNG